MNPAVEWHVDVERLIRLVESKPVLWDETCEVYQDGDKSKEAWREICCSLKHKFEGMSKEEQDKYCKDVIKTWNRIHDACVRYRKMKKDSMKPGTTKPTIYEEELEFLLKNLDAREKQDTCSLQEEDLETLKKPAVSRMRSTLDEPEDLPFLSIFESIIPTLETFTDEQVLQFQMRVLQELINIEQRITVE